MNKVNLTANICTACRGTGVTVGLELTNGSNWTTGCDACMGSGLSESIRDELEARAMLREINKDTENTIKKAIKKITTAKDKLSEVEAIDYDSYAVLDELLQEALDTLDPPIPPGADEPRYRDG